MRRRISRLRVGCLPRSGRHVPGWLIIPTLDMPEKTSLTSQYAFGQCGPIRSFIALRHILSKSCVLCTAHEISRPSYSTDPAPPRTGHATTRTKGNFTPTSTGPNFPLLHQHRMPHLSTAPAQTRMRGAADVLPERRAPIRSAAAARPWCRDRRTPERSAPPVPHMWAPATSGTPSVPILDERRWWAGGPEHAPWRQGLDGCDQPQSGPPGW